jgi:hypothetical protein
MEQQQELEIHGITFVSEPDNEYGPRWNVFESGSWEEEKHDAESYGTVENTGDDYAFTPNIGCAYPLSPEVLQIIVTFHREHLDILYAAASDERDTHVLTALGL